MNRRPNQYPFTCGGCGEHYEAGTTQRNQRNGAWVCLTCWETPTKVTVLPPAVISTCELCGRPLDASNRTVDVHGRVVHAAKPRKGKPSARKRGARDVSTCGANW